MFIFSSIASTPEPTPKLIGEVKGYSGKSITLTFTIKSMGVEVDGGGFKSGLIPSRTYRISRWRLHSRAATRSALGGSESAAEREEGA